MKITLETIPNQLSVCQLNSLNDFDMNNNFYFLGKTKEELSLVCPTENVPAKTINREDGWRGFKIVGILDFSLIGILAKISSLLADNQISIFAVSTYNTDYVLLKENKFEKAKNILINNGYQFK